MAQGGGLTDGKEETRRAMRARRKAVPPGERAAAAAAVCAKLLSRTDAAGEELGAGATVAVYLASPDEIDLGEYARRMLERRARLVAPRWNGREYELAVLEGLDARHLRRGPMGIMEPSVGKVVEPRDVSAWIVPGLAFTRDGRRLGYGGGWYDRLLAGAAEGCVKLGVAYSFQIVGDLPAEAHDVPLDGVVDEFLI